MQEGQRSVFDTDNNAKPQFYQSKHLKEDLTNVANKKKVVGLTYEQNNLLSQGQDPSAQGWHDQEAVDVTDPRSSGLARPASPYRQRAIDSINQRQSELMQEAEEAKERIRARKQNSQAVRGVSLGKSPSNASMDSKLSQNKNLNKKSTSQAKTQPTMAQIKEKAEKPKNKTARVKSAVPKTKKPAVKGPKIKVKKKNNLVESKVEMGGVLDLQTDSGHNIIDFNDDKAKQFEMLQRNRESQLMNAQLLSDYQIRANAFYADVTTSQAGWGQLISAQPQVDPSDIYVAKTLGGHNDDQIINIEKYNNNQNGASTSTFDKELKNTKAMLYDQGVVQAFQPEKLLYSKAEVEDAIIKAKNLDEILQKVESDYEEEDVAGTLSIGQQTQRAQEPNSQATHVVEMPKPQVIEQIAPKNEKPIPQIQLPGLTAIKKEIRVFSEPHLTNKSTVRERFLQLPTQTAIFKIISAVEKEHYIEHDYGDAQDALAIQIPPQTAHFGMQSYRTIEAEFEFQSPRIMGVVDTVTTNEEQDVVMQPENTVEPQINSTKNASSPPIQFQQKSQSISPRKMRASITPRKQSSLGEEVSQEEYYYVIATIPTISALYKKISREAFDIDSSEMYKKRSDLQLAEAIETQLKVPTEESEDASFSQSPQVMQAPKMSARQTIQAVSIPILSAYQQLVEKEMLSQEITHEVPEDTPIKLKKNTLRAKMNGIVMNKEVDLNESIDDNSMTDANLGQNQKLQAKASIASFDNRHDTPRSHMEEAQDSQIVQQMHMQEETESELIKEDGHSQDNYLQEGSIVRNESRLIDNSPFEFENLAEGQNSGNIVRNESPMFQEFQDGASSTLAEDVTLSSQDSVVEEMRSIKRMAIIQACQAEKVHLQLSKMNPEQVEKIQVPLLLQVIQMFKEKIDPSVLSEDQKLIYKNLIIAPDEIEFTPVLVKELESRNSGTVVMHVGTSADNAKFEVSNIKNFKMINQDFFTKSVGNKSTPRNEEMLGADSIRDQSLNGDENVEQADFQISHTQGQEVEESRVEESKDEIPRNEANGEQLQEMEEQDSIPFQNRTREISAIDQDFTEGTPDITMGLSPPSRIQGSPDPFVQTREKFSSVPSHQFTGLTPKSMKNGSPEPVSKKSTIDEVEQTAQKEEGEGEGTPNLGEPEQQEAAVEEEKTQQTVVIGESEQVNPPQQPNPGLFRSKKIVPEPTKIIATEGSQEKGMTKIDMTNINKTDNEDGLGPIALEKTDVLFVPGDPKDLQAEIKARDQTDKVNKGDSLPLIMKGTIAEAQAEAAPALKKTPGNFQKRIDLQKGVSKEDDFDHSCGESVCLTEESRKRKEEEEQENECTVKNCECKKGDPMAAMGAGPDGDGDKDDDDDQEIEMSWKGLVRFIAINHPVHPITKEKFSLGDRTTVNGYTIKLLDPCKCHVLVGACKKFAKKYYKASRGDIDERKMVRPESLKDLPQSESESSELEDEVGFGGLTGAGAHLGVGAIVYLQTMKTFCVLFGILTLLNLPVYFIYSQTTLDNDYSKPDKMFQYFTFGNFGRQKMQCSSVSATFDSTTQTTFNMKCDYPNHYMTEISYYGFLYQHDPRIGASKGEYQCEQEYEKDSGKVELRDPEAWAGGWKTAPIHSSYEGKEENQEETQQEDSQQENQGQRLLDEEAPQTEESQDTSGSEETADESNAESAEEIAEEQHDSVHDILNEAVKERLIQNTTISNIDSLCKSNSQFLFKDEKAYDEVQEYFKKYCFEQEECVINLEDLPERPMSEMISDTCKIRMQGDPSLGEEKMMDPVITSQEFLIVYGCQGSLYKIGDLVMHKQQYMVLMVVIDFIGVIFMVYIFVKLEALNAEYISIIDDNQITMKDFAVTCSDVLLDKYTQDLRLVKMKIWLHFTRTCEEFRLPGNNYEVCDVVLSLCNEPETLQLFKMETVQNEINVIKSKLAAGEFKNAQFFQKQEELEDLNDNYEREKDRYKNFIEAKRKTKAVGIIPKCHRIEKLDYIFVTFKNVECVDKVSSILAQEPSVSKMIRCLFCIKNKQQTDKEFLRQELLVTESVEPDEMKWETLKVPGPPNNKGQIILQLLSFTFITFSGAFQLIFEGLRFMLIAKEAPLLCPDTAHTDSMITMQQAYDDVLSEKPKGILNCFCKQEFARNPFAAPAITFTELDPNEEDTSLYCLPYVQEQVISFMIKLISATSIININDLISNTFQALNTLQSRHTTIETTKRSFMQIQILEFLNTGLIMCVVSIIGLNKALVTQEDWEIRPEKLGYEGFDSTWYFEVGRILTLSCFLSTFTSNVANLRGWCKAASKQRSDRDGDPNLKRFPLDEDDDTPNTKMMIQDDLEKLYEGPNFECEKALSRFMSVSWTLIVFSTGMPILYLIGFFFYLCTYLTNKLLIMKYYKRTDSILSREIPVFAVWLMRYAIVLKMFVGIYMLNNPAIIKTRDLPTKDQIPFAIDLKTIANNQAEKAGEPLPYPEGEEVAGDFTWIDYCQYLHQQLNVTFVALSISSYFMYLFSIKFGVIAWDATVGTFIKICIKIWFLLKFVFMYTSELLKKLYRCIFRALLRLKSLMRRRAKKSQAKVLAKAGKDHQADDDIDAEEDRRYRKELRKQEKAWKKADAGEEEQAADEESLSKTEGSEIQSTGAMGAIEEATRKMRIAARQAYEDEVIGSRADRTDYSGNFYKELTCMSLDQLYERSKKEYYDFRALFGFNQATEKYMMTCYPKNKRDPKFHRLRELFLEQCYMSNITEEDVKEYDGLLQRRLRDIEEVVDEHFEFIKTAIREDAEEKRDREIEKTFEKEDYRQKIEQALIEHKFATNPDLKFDDLNIYTYTKKLAQLIEFQDALIRAEKNDMNNRRNIQRICRMQGSLAQSYLIFDNPKYKVARKIYFQMEAEEQELRNQQEDDDLNEYESDSEEESEMSASVGDSKENFIPKRETDDSDDSEILDKKQLK